MEAGLGELPVREGGCHCGAVTYRAPLNLEHVVACNCSYCAVRGFLLTFVPKEQFELLTGQELLTEYRFNKKTIAHYFCRICGVEPFSEGVSQDGKPTVAINIRTVAGLDPDAIPYTKIDGKNF